MILLKNYEAPAYNIREIMRYARIRGADDSYQELIEGCIEEAQPHLCYRVSYTYLDVKREGGLYLGSIEADCETIKKAIRNAEKVLLFAATVGAPFDRLIEKYNKTEPSKALIMQAIGAERVESLCDTFCGEIMSELSVCGKRLTTRVSPGYGDIPLTMQREIFAVLDCPRKIGLTLDESLLMSPSKSVTAICGIVDHIDSAQMNRCSDCDRIDCSYRAER